MKDYLFSRYDTYPEFRVILFFRRMSNLLRLYRFASTLSSFRSTFLLFIRNERFYATIFEVGFSALLGFRFVRVKAFFSELKNVLGWCYQSLYTFYCVYRRDGYDICNALELNNQKYNNQIFNYLS